MNKPKATREVFEVGDSVKCDVCDTEFGESDVSGGFLFSNYAYCPICAIARIGSIRSYNEEQYITERCPPDLSFADWVRRMRYRTGNDKIIVTTWE